MTQYICEGRMGIMSTRCTNDLCSHYPTPHENVGVDGCTTGLCSWAENHPNCTCVPFTGDEAMSAIIQDSNAHWEALYRAVDEQDVVCQSATNALLKMGDEINKAMKEIGVESFDSDFIDEPELPKRKLISIREVKT
jgi:hypothetical protein